MNKNFIGGILGAVVFLAISMISIHDGKWIGRGGNPVFDMEKDATPFWFIQGILISGVLYFIYLAVIFYKREK